jgi:cell division septum initiation protein DivIVA
MNAVRENPYRTLGLFGNATEKELQKQIATIKRFAEVGKSKSFDYDFPFLGDFKREQETVLKAASRIEQAKNKVHFSLFWFLNTNHIDEAALNHLKEANIEKATEIWEKLIKDNTITPKNYSAALNLSTLQLGMTTLNGSFNPTQLKKCVELKGHIIASDAFLSFVQTVAGDNTSLCKETIRKEFVDEILQILKPYLNKTNGITSAQLIDAFNSFPTETKQYVAAKFTDRPISNIENQIEKAKQKRTSNASDAEEYGEELFKNTKEDLAFLKSVLGASNVNYQVLVNKVANEILQCSIDFFNEHNSDNDTTFDPFEDALKITKYAKSISPSGQIKNRVEEALNTLEEMRFRDAHQVIAFLNQIIGIFEEVEKENSNIEAMLSGSRTVVNEDKIMEIARPLLETQVIEIIAKSNKDDLIKDFFNSLNKLLSKISSRNSDFFNKKKSALISCLPITNSIKYNFEKSKLENELNKFQKELSGTKTKKMYASELQVMESEMSKIKEWQLFRSSETREQQIAEQKKKIDNTVSKGEAERKKEISRIEEQIVIKNRELQNILKK